MDDSSLTVGGITVLCHFRKKHIMPVINCFHYLIFLSSFHVISIPFCPKVHIGPTFLKK